MARRAADERRPYGVDHPRRREIAKLTDEIGEDVLLDRCGNALTRSLSAKILWLKRNGRNLRTR
jgi:xylulokinase